MQIAVVLRRLEADFNDEESEVPSVEERACKTMIRIATAANRCSWCSACELACYITSGALARRTHIPIAIFMSRPMYMLQECRRILQRGDHSVVSAPNVEFDGARPLDALVFSAMPSRGSADEPLLRETQPFPFPGLPTTYICNM